MTKFLLWATGILIVLVIAFGLLQYVASERVEVVTLKTKSGSETHLWIVDHDNHTYLRAGTPRAGWYAEVRADPYVTIERNGVPLTYHAVPMPEVRDLVNTLMREKYTWGDQVISMMIDRDASVPVELQSPAP
jgi:hypothetical protein